MTLTPFRHIVILMLLIARRAQRDEDALIERAARV